jgi:predicted ATP-grasp superfamily ATP-dependent carboligase
MRILLLEYVTGGGLGREPLPTSLVHEGKLMLGALAGDLAEHSAVEITVLRGERLSLDFPGASTIPVPPQQFEAVWHSQLARCDAVWPIAPETGGILEHLCRDVESAGKVLLTSPSAAVRLAASKLATIQRLERHGLPVVPTLPIGEWRRARFYPCVFKPDDGVGCDGAFIGTAENSSEADPLGGDWIVQPLLEAEPLSLSILFARGEARLLSCNRQCVHRTRNRFRLEACEVNAFFDTDGRWSDLAARIAAALPELWGYAGVDLMLTAQGPRLLEINPRLTTSYAGLHWALGENPAAQVLRLHETGRLPPPRRHRGKTVTVTLGTPHET